MKLTSHSKKRVRLGGDILSIPQQNYDDKNLE